MIQLYSEINGHVSGINGHPIDHGVNMKSGTASQKQLYHSTNPSNTNEVLAEVNLASTDTFYRACQAAATAQQEWADVPAPIRGQAIANLGRLITANQAELAALITREVGKPYREALGEVQEAIDTCDFFLGEGRRLYGQTVPSEMTNKQLFTFRNPVGVAAIVTAGNFPVAVPSWYLVPALLCGNAVVWKPAEYSALIAHAFFQLFTHAGFPPGVVNLVFATGDETYRGLEKALASGVLHKVGFTGSTDVGRKIGELCGRYLQSPCLELGGKNPMVIMPDADLDLATEGALFSGFGTAGQRCTSLGTVLVHEDVHEAFIARFSDAVQKAAIGDPRQDVLYGPLLANHFAERFTEYLGWISAEHRVLGSTERGRITNAAPRQGFVGANPEAGLFFHPTIVDGLKSSDRLFSAETFGPIVGVMSVGSLDEAIELANAPGFGLSSSIYTQNPEAVFRFRQKIGAGMVSVNTSTTGAESHLPFGGNGKSGNGSRQSGQWVLDQFTHWQSMNWDFSGRLQKAQLDVQELIGDPTYRLAVGLS